MEHIKLGECCPRVVNNSIAYDIQSDFNMLAENMPDFTSYAYCRNKKEFEEIQLNFHVKLWDIGEDFLKFITTSKEPSWCNISCNIKHFKQTGQVEYKFKYNVLPYRQEYDVYNNMLNPSDDGYVRNYTVTQTASCTRKEFVSMFDQNYKEAVDGFYKKVNMLRKYVNNAIITEQLESVEFISQLENVVHEYIPTAKIKCVGDVAVKYIVTWKIGEPDDDVDTGFYWVTEFGMWGMHPASYFNCDNIESLIKSFDLNGVAKRSRENVIAVTKVFIKSLCDYEALLRERIKLIQDIPK